MFINIFLAVGLGFLFVRLFRPQKDDPRLSRGLQLLQSKIAILEDLSDRTDHQFKQMGLLLDEKSKEVQSHITSAQEQIYRLGESMKKSQDVARIFQDKIPHEEIVERQNTVKYVRAAQMANQGYSVADIQKEIGIPASEAEFIYKVNKDRLMFSVENCQIGLRTKFRQLNHRLLLWKKLIEKLSNHFLNPRRHSRKLERSFERPYKI
jgi:mannose/fructose/N-acetylgalactosamine-specific phosphotransferase system component IIB